MLLKWLTKYRETGLLLLRIGLGVIFIAHGYPKLMGGKEEWAKLGGNMANLGIHFWPAMWGFMAMMAELGGGIMLILGLFFRPVLLIMTFNMFVAMVMHLHKGDSFATWSHPATIAVVFLSLLLIGPGKYSLDRQ
jgi:putative oxidoreductase